MSKILKDKPVKEFPIPEGIEFMNIDSGKGQPTPERETTVECFKEGTGATQKVFSRSKTAADFYKFNFNLLTNTQ
jgi:membrane carboxypeptidase/penicillin-binding protein